MRLFSYIGKSIVLKLAALMLLSSLVIGFGMNVWEMRFALSEQRQTVAIQIDEFFNLVNGGAASAAWALDPRLAEEVASAFIKHAGVIAIEIRADLNSLKDLRLVRVENKELEYDNFVNWTANRYFADIGRSSRHLTVSNQGKKEKVGTIFVEYSSRYAADRFLNKVYSTMIVGLIEALSLGLVLLIVTQWLVTTPLRRAAASISKIRPESMDASDHLIGIHSSHKNDELGQLLNHTNQLLSRLEHSRKELRQMATRDPLTNLANRTLIKTNLSMLIASAQRSSQKVAVIYLDLDRFKKVNDSLGHDIGDKLLQQVALTLQDQVRMEDSVSRVGGDEFLIVLQVDNVKRAIEIVQRIINEMAKPYIIESQSIQSGASFGIALYPDDGLIEDDLIRCADIAMYKAKSNPSVGWHLFSEEMGKALQVGIMLERALDGAISRDEMEIYLQPQFLSHNLQIAGCEALLRWKYNDQWISPVDFIEIAETSGQILKLGDWVIAEVCSRIKLWGENAIPISVNVSGRQLADPNFVPRVLETVKEYGIDPRFLVFEITETMLMQNLDESFERLNLLRKEGFRISIDDFGTGYSSLSYLTRLPIDELKIDRSFVSGSQRSPIVLNTIVAMGRALNIHVVAEGVETAAQQQELVKCGCDLLQGFLLGKPMPLDEFETRFKREIFDKDITIHSD